jgi:hypothetical protein
MILAEYDLEPHLVDHQPVADELGGLGHHLVDVEHRQFVWPRVRELQEFDPDVAAALEL